MGFQYHHQIVRDEISRLIRGALDRGKAEGGIPADLPEAEMGIEPAKRPEFGDVSSSVVFRLAKAAGMSPRDLAQKIAAWITPGGESGVAEVTVAGGGYLNFVLKKKMWDSVLAQVLSERHRYGDSAVGEGQRLILEYVSANPTGPLHVGHGRGAAVGDSLARLLRSQGFTVWREYYVNDVGNQIDLLGTSVLARFREECQKEGRIPEFGDPIPEISFPPDGYQGSYIVDYARELAREPERLSSLAGDYPEADWLRRIGIFARNRILEGIREDLTRFGVEFDEWVSEEEFHRSGAVAQAITHLQEKGYVDFREGAYWFKSREAFGDEKDRVLIKSSGEKTYFASDIAYHEHKFQRGFDRVINIWGADHHGYVPRVRAAIQALGFPAKGFEVILIQFVTLVRSGKPVSMSTRSGEFITLRELVDEVGRDAARFFFLLRKADSHLEFDLDLAKRQAPENPVYYVQYAHARISSVFREAERMNISLPVKKWYPDLLELPEERALIRQLAEFPLLLEESARAHEPHRLTGFLLELAGTFHRYYHDHRILPRKKDGTGEGSEEPGVDLRLAETRLALIDSIQIVLRKGLNLLGISSPEQM